MLTVFLRMQALKAVEHVHATGWLHHDIKLPNMLVFLSAGGEETVKLADFGSAVRLGTLSGAPRQTVFLTAFPKCSTSASLYVQCLFRVSFHNQASHPVGLLSSLRQICHMYMPPTPLYSLHGSM